MSAELIGLDIAKNIIQVHGVNAVGAAVLTKRLKRSQVLEYFANLSPCLIAIEACAGSHYWARRRRSSVGLRRSRAFSQGHAIGPSDRKDSKQLSIRSLRCSCSARDRSRRIRDSTQKLASMSVMTHEPFSLDSWKLSGSLNRIVLESVGVYSRVRNAFTVTVVPSGSNCMPSI